MIAGAAWNKLSVVSNITDHQVQETPESFLINYCQNGQGKSVTEKA